MSWNPPAEAPRTARDQRLDGFRDRAAQVIDDEGSVLLTAYVQTEFRWSRTGGHLWWRHWSHPEEFVLLHHVTKDTHTIAPLADVRLDEALDDWLGGRFEHSGKFFTLTWLELPESQQVRRDIGLDPAHPRPASGRPHRA
jgi:hypothetical protein